MDLTDARWAELAGADGRAFDIRPVLERLASSDFTAWPELWRQLHHQGDVGGASYGAVPALVFIPARRIRCDWNTYALAATIEEARRSGRNPTVPSWLEDDYRRAWNKLEQRALGQLPTAEDEELVTSLLAVLALAKGQTSIARLTLLTEAQRQAMLQGALLDEAASPFHP